VAVVRAALASEALAEQLRELLNHVLTQRGRILADSGPTLWPSSVLKVAAALNGPMEAAAIAAAAVELAVAAIDVADEIIDDEWQGDARSRARAVNASVALSFMGQACAGKLAELLGASRAGRIARIIGDGSLGSCAGQDLDLLLEYTDASDEQAYAMTQRKSGGLVAMAFKVGAAVATDDERVVDAAGTLGWHIGTTAQLLNDLQDVGADPNMRKGDIRRGKRTLPIAYALQCALEEDKTEMVAALGADAALSTEDENVLVERMHDLGAQQYTWTVAQAQRHQALTALRTLADVSAEPAVMRLRHLIPG
jgi:geranylgeranyl pyrophosphate synthase